jgi:tRNA nucleotidyltransferase (CCA-adding enzyme)
MKIYAVGGAVRDELLGLPVTDRDWVVVGATPEDMVAQGFKPVGRDFPVFLHPTTHEEYALARTERKTGPGYRGFTIHASPEVTLEQDLERRDLTINAMARDAHGVLVDPFGGMEDLRQRRLRHVSPAFAEDPVRILRVARFAARFKQSFNFVVADDTRTLMQSMVAQGEVDALVPERVWQELARGLAESTPSELFRVLEQCHALPRILPEVMPFWAAHGTAALAGVDLAAHRGHGLPVRFAAWTAILLQQATQGGRAQLQQLGERLRVPSEIRDLARMTSEHREAISNSATASAESLLQLIEQTDALRRPQRFEAMLAAHACHAQGDEPALWERLNRALQAALEVPAGALAQAARATPEHIPQRIRQARLAAVAAAIHQAP